MNPKRCTGCQNTFPPTPEFFHKRKASKDGLSPRCRTCESKSHHDYYATKKSKKIHRRSKLKINYNITIEDFDKMFIEQKGACKICGMTGVKLVVDHNHTTNEVRRLLCNGCNHGLGRFRDDPELLREAIKYLEDYGYSTVVGREREATRTGTPGDGSGDGPIVITVQPDVAGNT